MSEPSKDTGMSLKICHLYPTLMSVAADRGNLFSIQKRCEWRGIKTEVELVYVKQTPDFTQYDLILIHGAADREMELASQDIQLKAASLREAAEANVVFLCVCAGFQLMGHYYQPSKGARLKGVGLLDLYTEGGSERFMTHMAMECAFSYGGQHVLVGYENHSGRTYLGNGLEPLGKVQVGWGNNGKDGGEGAHYKNVFASYLHGPLLPKNPWFTDYLIKTALERRYGPVELSPLDDTIEQAAHDAALRLAMKFKGTMSAIEAATWRK
jgi:CobQ-like glutamine amidotransferase family enzyme